MSDVTLAVSSKAATQLFNAVRDNFTFAKSGSADFGPFSASYSIALHLAGGTFTLNNDDTVEISDLDLVWDTLTAGVCFNLPGFCIGGQCIIPDPFDGCWVRIPRICIGGPICISPNLSGLVSEVNDVQAGVTPQLVVDPARTSGESDLDAELAGHPNKWKFFIDPTFVHIDPVDFGPSLGNIIDNEIKNAIENTFWWVPSWALHLLWGLIGPLLDLFKNLLGIAGELQEWLWDLLGRRFDLVGIIETALAQYFASQYPLFDFEDPYPILKATGPPIPLIPVKIPIRNPAIKVNSHELIVLADVGA